MNKIGIAQFKYVLRDIHLNTENRKFCFVLGAGASYRSGIPTGSELATKWFHEIKQIYTRVELEKWEQEIALSVDDLAAHYGSIYRKRFETDKISGFEFLVQAMRNAKPTFGHIVLAQILSKNNGHCVLTTNFDNLVESALYQYTDKTPLVCGHESLSGYARPSKIHPLIIKIHRDLLLSPKSDINEISQLDTGWKEPLDNIFSSHIPIIIGYGGNDGSLMAYFEKMNRPSNLFWCGLSTDSISNRAISLIESKGGSFVTIDGFDEMMYELLWVFDEIKPIKEELDNITKSRIEAMNNQLISISSHVDSLTSKKDQKELSAFEYSTLAERESDLSKREQIYQEALEKFPKTAWLWGEYASFLHYDKKDINECEKHYLKALSLDSEDSAANTNYAVYQAEVKKDFQKAKHYFQKALEVEPDDAQINHNYANFLFTCLKDIENSEVFYLKILAIDPNNSEFNEQYASFLQDGKKDLQKAEVYFLKAIECNPKSITAIINYATLLTDKFKLNKAEEYYLRAIKISPTDAVALGNYAGLLFLLHRKEEATAYLLKAFKFNNDEKIALLTELWFYNYAYFPELSDESAEKIKSLLEEGIVSENWSLQSHVELAISQGHRNSEELRLFAKRISCN